MVPLIERVAGGLGAVVSVDTYKPQVAAAAIAAGAAIVNDVSALRDPELADVCATTGAGLVLMHTLCPPKQKFSTAPTTGGCWRTSGACSPTGSNSRSSRGVRFEQLMLDPGPDFCKTPAQTVEVLRGLADLHALGRPLLAAISRKDFVGALTGRPPRGRTAGTLAALGHTVGAGAHVARVHDVAAAADYIAVRDALAGEAEVDLGLRLVDSLRWERQGRAEP